MLVIIYIHAQASAESLPAELSRVDFTRINWAYDTAYDTPSSSRGKHFVFVPEKKLLCHTLYDKIEVFFGAHAQALWLCGCADIGRRGCLALFFDCRCICMALLSTSRYMKCQKIPWFYHKPYDTTIFVRV